MKRDLKRPNFSIEDEFDGSICGLDEAGRGPLAGPVVAACVIIPKEKRRLKFVKQIHDSKQVSAEKREELYGAITENFVFGIAEVPSQKIDEINILQASLLAMRLAYEKIETDIAYALVDGNHCPVLPCPAKYVIGGDARSISIAAASILAKVTRDRLMRKLAEEHPHYGWHSNVGYSTRGHLEAINRHGITSYHRRSFEPVRNFIEFGQTQRQLEFPVKEALVNH
jgi:ribonuclease HII